MKRLLIILAACLPLPAATAVFYGSVAQTTSTQCISGALCPLLAIPGAIIQVYSGASLATTYTDATATSPCPVNAQVSLPGLACVQSSDGQGNWGIWILPGTYTFALTLPTGGTIGPYSFSIGGTGSGGGATIAVTPNIIKGDNLGNGIDSGIPSANVIVSTGAYSDPSWLTALSVSKLLGQASVPNGGSGNSSLSGVLIGNGASPFTGVTLTGVTTQFLNGTGAFSTPPGTGTVTSVSGSGPSWLTWTIGTPSTTPAISLAPTTGQTSHLVIGTCGAATTFAPCALVAADIPTLNQNTSGSAATLSGALTQCAGIQFATGITANGNANCGTPSGGGSGYFSGLLDVFPITKTSGTVLTINANASASQPSNFRVNTTAYHFTSSATLTISGSSDTGNVYLCAGQNGTIIAKHNQSFTLTGSGVTVVTGQSSCGTDALEWQAHITANVWDAITEAMDFRESLFVPGPINGAGALSCSPTGTATNCSLTTSGTTGIAAMADSDLGTAMDGALTCVDGTTHAVKTTGCTGGGGASIANVTTIIVGSGAGNGLGSKVSITQPTTAATLSFPVDNATISFQGTDTYVGRATTDTFTNKTFDTAGTGNSFKIAGTAITAVSGTGAVCLASGSACGGGGATGFKMESMQNPAVTVTNTTTETTLATYTLGASELGNLQQLVSVIDGYWKCASCSPNMRIRAYFGATTVYDFTESWYGNTTSSQAFNFRLSCMSLAAASASSAVDCQGIISLPETTQGDGRVGGVGNTSTNNLATNGTLVFKITVTWSGADPNASVTATQFSSVRYN